MFGGKEYPRRVVGADDVVSRRVHDQQRLVQVFHLRHQIMLGDIVEELALDAKRTACE